MTWKRENRKDSQITKQPISMLYNDSACDEVSEILLSNGRMEELINAV